MEEDDLYGGYNDFNSAYNVDVNDSLLKFNYSFICFSNAL